MIDPAASVERPNVGANPARPNSVILVSASARVDPHNPWITFALVAVGTFLIMLDASIVNSSLPSVGQGLFMTPNARADEHRACE